MRRYNRRAQVIAYAIPQPKRQSVQPLVAAGLGLLTSLAIYAMAALLFS